MDNVNHPKHYTQNPSGVECIDITSLCSFCRGNCIKYIWRHMDKGKPIEDLKKALWYLDRCEPDASGWNYKIQMVENFDPFGDIIFLIFVGAHKEAKKLIEKRIKELENVENY